MKKIYIKYLVFAVFAVIVVGIVIYLLTTYSKVKYNNEGIIEHYFGDNGSDVTLASLEKSDIEQRVDYGKFSINLLDCLYDKDAASGYCLFRIDNDADFSFNEGSFGQGGELQLVTSTSSSQDYSTKKVGKSLFVYMKFMADSNNAEPTIKVIDTSKEALEVGKFILKNNYNIDNLSFEHNGLQINISNIAIQVKSDKSIENIDMDIVTNNESINVIKNNQHGGFVSDGDSYSCIVDLFDNVLNVESINYVIINGEKIPIKNK